MKKFLTIIKTHPKKIIFFSSLSGYGIRFARKKYEENCLMRDFCKEALKYGDVSHALSSKERHITVILNPASNDGKGKSLYDKYCAPLLHLSGMKVALVKTEHEGQAREIMSIMDNTDGVVVAGGDGILSEVLTGLLRREDWKVASRDLPLGIIPLGMNNSAASSIWQFNKVPEVKHLAEATMDIIRDFRKKFDVIEVLPMEKSTDGPRKPVYASSSLEWGALMDAKGRKSVYWYWATLKKYIVYVFSSYKDLNWNCAADLEYFPPCKGCSTCHVREKNKKEQLATINTRWWQAFMPRTRQFISGEDSIDFSSVINPECGKGRKIELEDVSDVRICSKNSADSTHINGHSLSIKIGKKNISALEFIWEGWRREKGETPSFDKELIAGQIILTPWEQSLRNSKGEERKFCIDNESYEVKPIKIRSLPDAVTIFAPSPQHVS